MKRFTYNKRVFLSCKFTTSRVAGLPCISDRALPHSSAPSIAAAIRRSLCVYKNSFEHISMRVRVCARRADDGRLSLLVPRQRRSIDFFAETTFSADLTPLNHRVVNLAAAQRRAHSNDEIPHSYGKTYPIPTQEANNASVTLLGLQVSMSGGEHPLSGGSHGHLPFVDRFFLFINWYRKFDDDDEVKRLRLGVTYEKGVTLGNVTMSHRTRERRAECLASLSHSTMIGLRAQH
ncbi:hypothetical protein EVAR_35760_1 [Eumeta japonica]|uniref:Uncharacterized protein n=1 Tax=Eumeta variegata TaxID=151549 RepID=A0A4C1WMR1_EUMVA|nr:hypothetical protein EVAR_35760_1 [Eumeta japonica]